MALILRAFKTLSRCRPQAMGDVPQAIPMSDVLAGWEVTGTREMGLTLKEHASWMQLLDEELIKYYSERKRG